MIFVITGTVNSVNLTDGLDGLSSSVTIIVAIFYLIIGIILQMTSVVTIAIIIIGALLGFLKYNWKPAKVFMGDTGSLALGGLVVALAMVTKTIVLLPLVGIIYFAETLSVILQVAYYKMYGQRIFRMSPLHHHYELVGLKEKTIVKRFALVSFFFIIISLLILLI
jgi:phospho-N-acetylmuramoyl-pentapeptide-transferase